MSEYYKQVRSLVNKGLSETEIIRALGVDRWSITQDFRMAKMPKEIRKLYERKKPNLRTRDVTRLYSAMISDLRDGDSSYARTWEAWNQAITALPQKKGTYRPRKESIQTKAKRLTVSNPLVQSFLDSLRKGDLDIVFLMFANEHLKPLRVEISKTQALKNLKKVAKRHKEILGS